MMNSLKIVSLNCRGQTKMNLAKQLQIQDFLKVYNIDILMCQETSVDDDTFNLCDFIKSNFTIIINNSHNEYGTCCLIKNSFKIGDVSFDTEGRIIIFNLADFTFVNVYLPSGTDAITRSKREKIISESLPNLLINRKREGILLGDWNCIVCKEDSMKYPEIKISPSLRCLIKVMDLNDFHHKFSPKSLQYSHYYKSSSYGAGATRIDRGYWYGNVIPLTSEYIPIACSDHLSYHVTIRMVGGLEKMSSPRRKPFFKVNPAVVDDVDFKEEVSKAMLEWNLLRQRFKYPIKD